MAAKDELYGTPSAFANSSLDKNTALRIPLFNSGIHWRNLMKSLIGVNARLGVLVRQNVKMARRWKGSQLAGVALDRLREMTLEFGFSVALGDFATPANWLPFQRLAILTFWRTR